MSLAFLISAALFLLILLAGMAVSFSVHSKWTAKAWQDRIERRGADALGTAGATRLSRLTARGAATLAHIGQIMKPKDEMSLSTLRQGLVMAGYRAARAPLIFLGAKVACMVALPTAIFLLRTESMKVLPASAMLVVYVVAAMIGFYGPHVWLRTSTARRQRKLLEGFPDAIDLLVICVESGLGLGAAIGRVGEELKLPHPVLSDEFHVLSLELRTGLSRPVALRNLSRRTGLEDVKSLVAMLVQTDRFGTSIAQALRLHSDFMRKQRHLRAEELAAKVPVKLLFPLILFIFPNLFVVILGPGVIRIFRTLLPALNP